jgi:hypothetical protein
MLTFLRNAVDDASADQRTAMPADAADRVHIAGADGRTTLYFIDAWQGLDRSLVERARG